MRVIFLQNIKGVARIGDIKNVNDGYARNYLLPKRIARTADATAEKQAETLVKMRDIESNERKERGLKLAQELAGMTLEIHDDANDQGHLYGGIDAKRIVKELHNKKINISEEYINLPHHLKTTGEHEVEIEFHPEVKAKLKVIVTSV